MNTKIIVIGDIILDKYIYGNVDKISQESPTAIVNVDINNDQEVVLGGAANVATNINNLGGQVKLYSIIGNDKNSLLSKKVLKNKKINYKLTRLKNYFVTEKIRIISNSQQILRLDKDSPKIKYNQNLLNKSFRSELANSDYLLISDYNKGTIQNLESIVKIANKKNVKVLIDSKIENISSYKNSFLIKPNKKEFEKIFNLKTSEKGLNKKIIKLIKKLNINYLLLTKGKEGMTLFSKNGVKSFKSGAKEVFDVTGAGDTVLASLAVSLSQKKSILDSIKFSLKAAEIAISKLGTSAVSLKEISENQRRPKVVKEGELKKIIQEKKKIGKKIVFTNGCFDLLHSGHIHILKEAKKRGDILIVGLNSDKSVKKIKGKKRPLINEIDRAAHLESLEFVDFVVIYNDKTPEKIIRKINPDILVKGSEYKNKFIAGKNYILKKKGKVILVGKYKNYSTTKLLDTLK